MLKYWFKILLKLFIIYTINIILILIANLIKIIYFIFLKYKFKTKKYYYRILRLVVHLKNKSKNNFVNWKINYEK